jgi:hypothetical protein
VQAGCRRCHVDVVGELLQLFLFGLPLVLVLALVWGAVVYRLQFRFDLVCTEVPLVINPNHHRYPQPIRSQ